MIVPPRRGHKKAHNTFNDSESEDCRDIIWNALRAMSSAQSPAHPHSFSSIPRLSRGTSAVDAVTELLTKQGLLAPMPTECGLAKQRTELYLNQDTTLLWPTSERRWAPSWIGPNFDDVSQLLESVSIF